MVQNVGGLTRSEVMLVLLALDHTLRITAGGWGTMGAGVPPSLTDNPWCFYIFLFVVSQHFATFR